MKYVGFITKKYFYVQKTSEVATGCTLSPTACMNMLRQADCQLLLWVMNLRALSMEFFFSFVPPIMWVFKVKAECTFLRFGLVGRLIICFLRAAFNANCICDMN